MSLINWPRVLGRYLIGSVLLHLVWEVVQLPLYTLWTTGTAGQKAFAVIHCTIGDTMIAGLSLLLALAIAGRPNWPNDGTRSVWLLLIVFGAGYTIYSEWLNVNVRGAWSYSGIMPALPIIGTGLAPLLQWIVVPTLVLRIALGRAPWIDAGPIEEHTSNA